jgi:hypothetical protein
MADNASHLCEQAVAAVQTPATPSLVSHGGYRLDQFLGVSLYRSDTMEGGSSLYEVKPEGHFRRTKSKHRSHEREMAGYVGRQ